MNHQLGDSYIREVGNMKVLIELNLLQAACDFKLFILDLLTRPPLPYQDLRLGRVHGSGGCFPPHRHPKGPDVTGGSPVPSFFMSQIF